MTLVGLLAAVPSTAGVILVHGWLSWPIPWRAYFEVYPEIYHHPQEDLVFAKLRTRDPAAAAKVGDLAREHQKGAERLRRVAHAVDNVLADREVLRQHVDTIVRDFIEHERRHMMMEDRDFCPAALQALEVRTPRGGPA